MAEQNGQTHKIVKGELVTYFARACMIAATLVGLPAAGFMMTRVINQNDTVAAAVAAQNVSIQLLSQSVRQTFDGHTSQLQDHELRLRQAERALMKATPN
jgi:hypothetical protein